MGINLSWALLNNLAQRYGDSFYLLDLAQFASNYQEFLAAFRSVYAKSQIAYSYKTNYTPRLCQIVNRLGGYAEVVSAMEYGLARRLGVPAERIIFNGPYKQPVDLETALLQGSVVNLDAAYEVALVQTLAARYPHKTLRLGIRCNFEIGATERSRFGFDVERSNFPALLQTLRSYENCHIVGLHCHFLAPQRSAIAYGEIARRMVQLALTEFADIPLEFIDLGGGFFSRMSPELQQQFPYPISSFAEYGRAIAGEFAAAFPQASGPELILEPGIALTADTMKFVAQTIDRKQVGNRSIALVAGSIYDIKPTLNTRNLPMTVWPGPNAALLREESQAPVDIVGYTCMENDCLYRGYGGELASGDYVVFDNVGAYTNVLRPPFINPAPPILSMNKTGAWEEIRRRETAEDIFATYAVEGVETL